MGDSSEQLLALLATEPWRPKSLLHPRMPELSLRVRVGVLGLRRTTRRAGSAPPPPEQLSRFMAVAA